MSNSFSLEWKNFLPNPQKIYVSPKTVATAPAYNADTFYTLQNMGTSPVQFSLSTTTDIEGPEIVTLNGGETRSRLAENLAPMGVFLVVKNANAVPVKVRVWVE